jgi:hypothetical protein
MRYFFALANEIDSLVERYTKYLAKPLASVVYEFDGHGGWGGVKGDSTNYLWSGLLDTKAEAEKVAKALSKKHGKPWSVRKSAIENSLYPKKKK